jgi:hypothetical protein
MSMIEDFYSLFSLLSIVIFALVHVFAEKTRSIDTIIHGRFLSICGGVAISYVFIDILPKLCISDIIVKKALSGIFPYIEYHVYIMALTGFLLFFIVGRSHTFLEDNGRYYLSLTSYACFNFFVAYSVADPNNPDVRPLSLFKIAMGLHYFTNDYALNQSHEIVYDRYGKWILVYSLFLGWIVGLWYDLSEAAVAVISAFIAGGVILNVTQHELPEENPNNLGAFLFAAAVYTLILLVIGNGHGNENGSIVYFIPSNIADVLLDLF